MALYRRANTWWFEFWYRGERIRQSTKLSNKKKAREAESAVRTALARGDFGILERKPVPTLKEFIEARFEPWAKAQFEKASPATWFRYYRTNLRTLKGYGPLTELKLDKITGESVANFAAQRQSEELQPGSINRSLQVLRRVLRLAVEWGVVSSAPKIKLLRNEGHRERVVAPTEEARYLAAAPEPLVFIATILVDSGMRPEECFRLCWESVTWVNGRYGCMLVTHGKTAAARRVLPMTPRVRAILEMQWERCGRPLDGWIWPAPTRSGHVEPSTLKKKHTRTFQKLTEQAKENNENPIRPFVLYSLRHTFLTRLGQSGCNVWNLARIAGHSSITMSARYVHPSEDDVLNALEQLQVTAEKQTQVQRPALPA
jgi:integrase